MYYTTHHYCADSHTGRAVFSQRIFKVCLQRSSKPPVKLYKHRVDGSEGSSSVPSPSLPSSSNFRPAFSDFGPPPWALFSELLSVIEEMSREIRPTYAGSKSAMERLKRGIIHARALVRECLAETERSART
ncbi:hypothetical protein F7725_005446 [Dissostichus mawsoni]|uniref:Cyclin-dependent kinase 2-associated protein n=1 Tax=Dissostichus mawsoni TaxID=36200 RepID=A0A7J5YT31_DISMA|nr:hypothetical protein F7725_005446 [Dissostichus mawsoni]